jgi:hypothetical protein
MVPGLFVFYESNIKLKNEMLYKVRYNIIFLKKLFIPIKNDMQSIIINIFLKYNRT